MLKKFLLYILLGYFSFSCNERKTIKNVNQSIIELNIRSIIAENEKEVKLSKIARNIKFIPLETNESCLLRGVNNIYLSENYIFITDSQVLYQFNNSGKFIRQIGKPGKGPGEHGRNIKFTIDEFNKEIYILSYATLINIFDLESGIYKRSLEIKLDIANFYTFPKGKITFFTRDSNIRNLKSSLVEVFLFNNEGTLEDSILNTSRTENKSNSVAFPTSYINNNLFYVYHYKDTLFYLTKDFKKHPYVFFNLGNKINRNELYIEPIQNKIQYPDFLWVSNILENNEFMFITIQNGIAIGNIPNTKKIIYEKRSGRLIPTYGYVKDGCGGLFFWPRWISDGKLISYYHSYELIDHYKLTKETDDHSEDFKKLVSILEENHNPVLVFAD